MKRRQLIVLAGLAVSAFFLWLAVRGLDPVAFWQSVQQAKPWLIIGGMLVYGAAVTVITLRWQFLLRAITSVPLTQLIPLVAIGYMGNNIYPLRSGEVLRVFLLRRNHDVPLGRGATTVAVERVFDGLVMLTFLIVPLALIDVAAPEVRRLATLTTPIFLTALAVFLGLAARPTWLLRLAEWVAGWLPGKLGDVVGVLGNDIVDGLAGLRSPVDLAGTVVCSYATWAIEAVVYWMVAFAFGLSLGYPVMLMVVAVVNLSFLLPAAPGNVGLFEFFASAVLVAVGISESTALAYAVAVHVVIWLPPTLAGFVFLARQGLNLSAVTQANDLQSNAV